MKQFKHTWLFVHPDQNAMEIILRADKKYPKNKVEEASKYKLLIDLGYKLLRFEVDEVNAFQLYIL